MGAFFTNVQVSVAGRDGREAREALLRVLRELAAEQGLTEIAAGEAEAEAAAESDRTILVGEVSGPWIGVYDEATEGQDEQTLAQLAKRLSAALQAAVVSVLVHDSDVLLLALYERGKRLARYDSNPGYFSSSGGGKRRRAAPKVEPWLRLLAAGRGETELAAAMREEKVFAEETLERIAGVFGMEPPAVAAGYEHARAGELSFPVTALRFRSAARPAHARAPAGPPRFEAGAAHTPALEGAVGFPLRASFGARNAGGAGNGLDVVVWGDAVARGLVRAREAQLVVGPGRASQPRSAALERRASEDGGELWVASFADVDLPAGVEGGVAALGAVSPAKMMEALYRANVQVNLTLDALAAGEGELLVGFVPRQAPDTGRFGHRCQVTLRAASGRPLRAAPNASAQLVRPLEVTSTLFGLVSAAGDLPRVAALAGELVERWGARLPEGGKYSLSMFPGTLGQKPQTVSAAARGFFASARWKKVKQELTAQAVVIANRAADAAAGAAPGASAGRSDGFAFGRSIILRQMTGDGDVELPSLALWMDVQGRPDAEIQAARELLVSLVDQMMSAAAGVQGLVGRWGQAPAPPGATPYELACGVHGQCTSLRSWQTRYLRGVTDDWIWLGPDLAGHVRDRAALVAAAVVEPLGAGAGAGIRVRLRPAATLDALEAALAELLPGPADWLAGMGRYYGRGA